MNTHLSPIEHAAMIDNAKARAHELRQQAIRAGWDTFRHALLRAWHAARRWMPRHRAATMGG